MTFLKFLATPIAALPKPGSSKDFAEYYKQITDEYFKKLKTVTCECEVDREVLSKVSVSIEIRDCVLQALRFYLSGHPGLAYSALEEMVKNHISLFQNIVAKRETESEIKNLYRIRTLTDKPLSRSDMFHIPFNLRRKVSSQRYSIPGFPSLYLSSSLFTAWKELSTPDLNTIAAVRVDLKGKVQVLDFGHPPAFLGRKIKGISFVIAIKSSGKFFDLLTSKFILWPLMAACSIKVNEQTAPFKPEYIIPQLILQLLRNDAFGPDIQGIRYFSMNYGQVDHSIVLGTNYVFPVKESLSKGHCPLLKKLVSLTEPLPWQLANCLTDEADVSKASDEPIELSPGYAVSYRSTKFARVESLLLLQKTKKF
jgi:hypothetical protein